MGDRFVLDDFNLFGGIHCETSAVRKVFLYHNLPISEEMLFGLGGGIGFIYWHMKQMPAPLVGGRGGGRYFIESAAKRAGANLTIKRTSSSNRGHAWLMEKLAKKEPTVIYADMAYLPYMGVPEDAHFGQHVFVVYGVDENENVVYISDRGKRGVTVTVEELKQARVSKYPPWPPKHAIFDLTLPKSINITRKQVKDALRDCIDGMLNPPIRNIGLKGFQKWANLVLKWPDMFKGVSLWNALYQGFIYIETGGTGGSAFRPMFARFLHEANEVLAKPHLDKIIEKYQECGRIWSKIAELYLPNEYPVLAKARQIILEQNRVLETQQPQALKKSHDLNQQLGNMLDDILAQTKNAPAFLPAVKEKILELYLVEKEAIQMLKQLIA